MDLKFILFLGLLLLGCNNLKLSNTNRLKNIEYNPGYPHFKMNGYYKLHQNSSPELIITGEIVYSSLNFEFSNAQYKSTLISNLEIENIQSDSTMINESNRIHIVANDFAETNSEETFKFRKSFFVDFAEYEVSFSLVDSISSKTNNYSFRVTLPSPKEEKLIVGHIQILQKQYDNNNSNFEILSNKEIQNKNDSLKFQYQILSNLNNSSVNLTGRIIKFESDTTIAESMNSLKPLIPIETKGIDYSSYNVVYSFNRTLNNTGYINFQYGIPNLSSGNYRFEVQAKPSSKSLEKFSEVTSYKAIEFSVRSSNFPELLSPKEKAISLQYLMTKARHKDLMAIDDDVALEEALNKFWNSKINNPRISGIIMDTYYSRVKEANKRYTNFKEGWKTDRGMVYILFGEPKRIQKNVNTVIWSFTYNIADFERIFSFEKPKQKNKFYPFENYILIRSDDYFNVQYQQIQKWLNALIPLKK